MSEDGVYTRLKANGELISAVHDDDVRTEVNIASGGDADWHIGTLTVKHDESEVLTAEARVQPMARGRLDLPATSIYLRGGDFEHEIHLYADQLPGRVLIREQGVGSEARFDFRTWKLVGTPNIKPAAIPDEIVSALSPLLPTLRAAQDHFISVSGGLFSPELGRPPGGIPANLVQADDEVFKEDGFETGLAPGWVCHAWCWGTAGGGTALCCLGSGGTLCVVCGVAEGVAASICSDGC
jgi:hypothetical protein